MHLAFIRLQTRLIVSLIRDLMEEDRCREIVTIENLSSLDFWKELIQRNRSRQSRFIWKKNCLVKRKMQTQ
jgi:hypothetical protein